MRRLKLYILGFVLAFCVLGLALTAYAKEVVILYSGETHAMLYPCNCPKEPDGGVARRATLIKQIKKGKSQVLLLDSGGFFAGGLTDEYTQNAQLDMERSGVNLKAMELMQYDAVTVGDDEFNFGREFFEGSLAKAKIKFLSANIKSDQVSAYIIKEVDGIKFGIIGLTSLAAAQKAGGLEVLEPKAALKGSLAELKQNNPDIIILLSHLGESEDLNLLKDIPGIDILVVGHARAKDEPFGKAGSTLIVRPFWQGRRLGKLSLTLGQDKKIANYKVEDIRLSANLKDDKDILEILPSCFSDSNCKKEGFLGSCQDAGSPKAHCVFNQAAKVNLTVISPRACLGCDNPRIVDLFKRHLPGLKVTYYDYPDAQAGKLIKELALKTLPVYLLGKEAAKEKGFDALKENLEERGNYYMAKTQVGGVAYFLNRQKARGKLDLFISLYDKDTPKLLETVKELNPQIHFLTVEKDNKFDAAKGSAEAEEYLRSTCLQKYYPEYFWDYLTCRAKDINSSWWEDCCQGLDINKIKACAKSTEGSELLKENIRLNKELEVMFGPAYLLDNQEIFSSQGVPKKEELQKIIKR